MFTLFDVKIIQIWTFPPAPSTERVPSLPEQVGYVRLFNWRVPALKKTRISDFDTGDWRVSLVGQTEEWTPRLLQVQNQFSLENAEQLTDCLGHLFN